MLQTKIKYRAECSNEEFLTISGQLAIQHELINHDALLEEAKVCNMKPLANVVGTYITSLVSVPQEQTGMKIQPAGHVALKNKYTSTETGLLYVEIGALLVMPDHRGKGVAHALIEQAMQEGNYQHGYSNFMAKCNDDSAITFESHGFKYNGDCEDKYMFIKSIGGKN